MSLRVTDIRQRNIAKIFHALRRHPGSSQRELVEATGVDQGTVSVIVKSLEGLGLLERTTRPSGGRVGRPESALRISPRAGVLVGASLEPDAIEVVVTALDGEVLKRGRAAGSRDVEAALDALEAAVDSYVAELGFAPEQVHGLGLGVPGILAGDGTVMLAPNLGWRDVRIAERLQARFAAPTYLDNDSNAAAVAEKLFGEHREARDFLYLNGHSGVGAGLVLDGELYRGARGLGGEIGHMKIVADGRPCACGGHGCLETHVSGRAILEQLAELGTELHDLDELAEAARRGDPEVDAVLVEAAALLGFGLANLVNIFNPERIVLGGSLALLLERQGGALREQLQRHALPDFKVELSASSFGDAAVPLGGVALALEGLFALLTGPAERFRTGLREVS